MSLSIKQGEGRANAWNAAVPVGTPCFLVNDDGKIIDTETTSEAWCLGHGAPVVKVKGKSGGYALERIIPQLASPPMQVALCIFLGFTLGPIGESHHCVIPFGSEEAAKSFAISLLRANPGDLWPEIDVSQSDDDLLEEVQNTCGMSEYFHIYPIRSVISISVG